MKKCNLKRWLAVSLALTLVFSFVGCGKKEEAVGSQESNETRSPNLFENGDFSNGTDLWGTYCYDGECSISVNENEELDVDIQKLGSVDYGNQLFHDGFSLEQGCVYRLTFDAYSDVERPLQMRFQINGGDYHAYYQENLDITKESKTYFWVFQ